MPPHQGIKDMNGRCHGEQHGKQTQPWCFLDLK
uniref:Uncharacterized protein n=1 Tax=Arundo donax TaxID=35708 RepID=A0A0A9AWN7_ARUDO